MAGEIRSLFLEGPAGRLEALLNAGEPGASHAALVCHPHPLYGGTMHNKVVFHAMKSLNAFGLPVLRFNFRGAGLSEGEHGQGRGETDDVRAALDWLEQEFHLPIIFAGFSFGASVGLRTCCPDARVPALISLGTPVLVEGRAYSYEILSTCAKPKLMVSGARDLFGPVAQLESVFAHAAEPKKLVILEGADHFFDGRLREMQQAIEEWLPEAVAGVRKKPAAD
jgi:uncharacterized protein